MSSTNTYTAQDRTPYTYFIRWDELDLNYYGRRTAKGCQPEEFFITYFTSSIYVADIIAEYGMPNIIKIHKIFSDIDSCKIQEERFLTKVNASRSLSWLNQTNGDKKFDTTGIRPPIYDDTNCKRILTVNKLYTVNNISQIEEVKHKKLLKSLEKYGAECPLQSPLIKLKSQETKIKLYGDKNFNNREKTKQTNLKKYGTESHNSIPEIKQKKINKTRQTYGVDNPFQSEEIKTKIKLNNIKIYGVDHIAKVKFLTIIETKKSYNKSIISKLYPEFKQFY